MTTLTIRIDENLTQEAFRAAEKLGIPLTLIVKNALQNFIKEPKVVIGESQSVDVTPDIQKKMNQVAKQLKAK